MCLLWRKYFIILFLLMSTAVLQAQDQPGVAGSFPHEGSTDILRNAFISVKLKLPNGHLDSYSVNTDNIKLYPKGKPEEAVPAFITLNNKLWSLIFEPYGMLEANTAYTFEISDEVKDQKGVPFEFTSFTFETGERAYRKLISMNRPFGESPAPGEWKEKDVSGEDLSAPFLREATPAPKAVKVVEPPKPLKPERSRDELLALVLRFYGGPKLPPGFGPTVLEAPDFPVLAKARLREIPVSFETLMELAEVRPEDTIEVASAEPSLAEVETQQEAYPLREENQPSTIDSKISIRDKWIMAALDEIEVELPMVSLVAPEVLPPSRLSPQRPEVSVAEVEALLSEVNMALLAEDKQAQVAMEAEAEALAAKTARLEANKRKTEMQEKWRLSKLENVFYHPALAVLSLPEGETPGRIDARQAEMSLAEVEDLLTEVNLAMLEEEKQEQVAQAEQAEADAARQVERETQASLARKTEMQEKWRLSKLENISFHSALAGLSVPEGETPGRVEVRQAEMSLAEVEALLTEVNLAMLEEEKQEQVAQAEQAEADAVKQVERETQASLARKNEIQEKWNQANLEKVSFHTALSALSMPSEPTPSKMNTREPEVTMAEVERMLTEVNLTLLEEEKQAQVVVAEVAEPVVANEAQSEVPDPTKTQTQTPTQPQPSSPSINTASLLVEETIKNKDRAGSIVFPQTAIFINEFVLVEFDLPKREFVSFVLRDINGDVYRTEGGYVEAGPHKRAVTLEGIPAGAYEAVVETIHQKVVRKVTILE